ncbi:MAG: hypothetical protein CL955_01180 [Erythrobacteraceae bacterium]|nr:hypothetical protein [Erythrobacteraceae bacterium]
MNNANSVPVDIEEMRFWALAFIEESNPPITQTEMAKRADIAVGTMNLFLNGKYTGRNDRVARKILQFKQQVEADRAADGALPVNPGYFETETSAELEQLLLLAHTGRITAAGTAPGTGKTITIEEYRQKVPHVYVATMAPSSKRLVQMIRQVLSALKYETSRILAADGTTEVIKRLIGKRALLVIDEANHLSIDALDEIRSWHDATGCGICLLGNKELIRELESGKNKTQLARLNSRIAWKFQRETPTEEDVRLFCDAWQISDPAMRKYLRDIATTRDSGGLRECRQIVEIASLFAARESRGLILDDLRDVQAQRASRWISA